MIFRKLELNNLFSYRGRVEFDLAGSAGQGNVTVILGRNGYGKTSLLNAVKLLFLGTEEKTQRRVGFPPRNLGRTDYVLGSQGKWAGIMNRSARQEGVTVCSVRAELGDADATHFAAERKWEISGSTFREDLLVEKAGRVFRGESAEQRLAELMPRELVPFYFFDGEEIQTLAEGGDEHRADALERLLSLSFINGVQGELSELTRDWRREQLPEEVREAILECEKRLEVARARVDARHRKLESLEQLSLELEDEAGAIAGRIKALRSQGGLHDAESLEAEIRRLGDELQDEQNELAYAVASDAPLTANPSLLQAAAPYLQEAVDAQAGKANSVFDTLFEVLPERLFNEPPQPTPQLSESQKRFYGTKLRRILDSFSLATEGAPVLLESLDLPRARELLEKAHGLSASAPVIRQDRARRLREVSKRKSLLQEKRAELRELEFGSGSEAVESAELEKSYADCQQRIGRTKAEIEKVEADLRELDNEMDNAGSELRALEKKEYAAEKNSTRLKIAVALRESFSEYRKAMRAAKRGQIESALNDRFSQLMSGHELVHHIHVDEAFIVHLQDAEGRPVGRSSISHGMRQLVVTALLWALKDVSGRGLPVIVDTPLARIDRGNQENLLRHYYPNAADQVIVLATDSELDERKFEILRPHLSKFMILHNADGESTTVLAAEAKGAGYAAAEDANG